jgi:hypothetical protein
VLVLEVLDGEIGKLQTHALGFFLGSLGSEIEWFVWSGMRERIGKFTSVCRDLRLNV